MGSPDAGGRIGASTTCAREFGWKLQQDRYTAAPVAGPCAKLEEF
jgi:hypothetical protein